MIDSLFSVQCFKILKQLVHVNCHLTYWCPPQNLLCGPPQTGDIDFLSFLSTRGSSLHLFLFSLLGCYHLVFIIIFFCGFMVLWNSCYVKCSVYPHQILIFERKRKMYIFSFGQVAFWEIHYLLSHYTPVSHFCCVHWLIGKKHWGSCLLPLACFSWSNIALKLRHILCCFLFKLQFVL